MILQSIDVAGRWIAGLREGILGRASWSRRDAPSRVQGIVWHDDLSPQEWDDRLIEFGGHPRQSAFWESMRTEVDGVSSRRLMATVDQRPIGMVRYERRLVPRLGTVAWMPRGPVGPSALEDWLPALLAELSADGIDVAVSDQWKDMAMDSYPAGRRLAEQAIWLDLGLGRDALWRGLDTRSRNSVGLAQKQQVTFLRTRAQPDIEAFAALCKSVGTAKKFHVMSSTAKIAKLLDAPGRRADLEPLLFIARLGDELTAGAFIIRFGRSAHYIWGATDRRFSRARPGEALQWAIIEWALDHGVELYDLGGVDPVKNPGVYDFKRKFGGRLVEISGKVFIPITRKGRRRLDRYLKTASFGS